MWYNKNMKAKITLTIQTIGMYLMHLPLYATLIIIHIAMDDRLQGDLIHGLLIASFVMMLIMIPLSIVNAALTAASALKGNDPTKPTMVAKLSLIPWYALNLVIGFVFVSIFFNPFMMIAIPLVIALLVASTYLLMLSTSVGNIAYAVHSIRKGGVKASVLVGVVFSFIFGLDVIGAIILYKEFKKLSDQAQTDASTADLQ